ncbi:MAG: protein translocase subunit SecD [Paracoccaceae bacterium]
MLHFSLWKKIVILLICAWGLVAAAPNVYYTIAESSNDAVAELEAGLPQTPERLAARDAWPQFLPSDVVNLGLDLRGGAHLLVEVAVEDIYAERLDSFWTEALRALRNERDALGSIRRQYDNPNELRIRIENSENMRLAIETAHALTSPVISLSGAGSRDFVVSSELDELVITLSDAERLATDERTMEQSLEIVRRRIDEAGTREPTIQRQGSNRILIQVPGIGSAEELLALLGETAKLTFNAVTGPTTRDANTNPGAGNLLLPSQDEEGLFYIVSQIPVVGGDQLTNAQAAFDQNGRPSVSFSFNVTGARLFGQFTAENIGQPFAIVLDGKVVSAPVIQSHISGGAGQITGNFTLEETTRLSILLRAGALPAELKVMEQRTVGPELGADSVEAGKIAALVGFAGVAIFMVLSYGMFGMIANIALFMNVAMIFGLLSAIGGTLTLPGIAGIVLTMGMAVDANVLIFERTREELRAGRNPFRAVEEGYSKALSAIIDGNLTTLIAAIVLYAFGSGPIRGFAITLGLGIVTSVFTAIWLTRLILSSWLKWRRPKTLTI